MRRRVTTSHEDYMKQISGRSTDFSLDFERTSRDATFLKRAAGNEEEFHILPIYNLDHKEHAAQILYKKRMYPPVIHDFWRTDYPGLTDKELIRVHWTGMMEHSLELKDLDQKCLSKMTRDLAIQFGLL